MPIHDKRLLRAVQVGYFTVPILLGYAVMQAVIPTTDSVRSEIANSPTGRQRPPLDERHKQHLQSILDEAAARHERSKDERAILDSPMLLGARVWFTGSQVRRLRRCSGHPRHHDSARRSRTHHARLLVDASYMPPADDGAQHLRRTDFCSVLSSQAARTPHEFQVATLLRVRMCWTMTTATVYVTVLSYARVSRAAVKERLVHATRPWQRSVSAAAGHRLAAGTYVSDRRWTELQLGPQRRAVAYVMASSSGDERRGGTMPHREIPPMLIPQHPPHRPPIMDCWPKPDASSICVLSDIVMSDMS
eukprot:CAMPEP_0185202974 /NCGR_PEP_ID=MMETSP1140-20130426/52086_1 /TAXON_ID=298111 /ORGANISM="Pavlova sp., Strain CCMP459" /LENGTH=304 /DNA_ID=CAMNT_0027770451 /DNA_START=45 /DNA_END=961 /DNA_ORIENTATION=-